MQSRTNSAEERGFRGRSTTLVFRRQIPLWYVRRAEYYCSRMLFRVKTSGRLLYRDPVSGRRGKSVIRIASYMCNSFNMESIGTVKHLIYQTTG